LLVLVYHAIMETMNERIREAVRIELARRRMTKSALARKVGKTPQYLSQIMNGQSGDVPDVWQNIFDELELDLVVVPREQ
jgi:transcriptional regulator with XRE-family HTH domain